jgi:F0F1-type ATP synthase delta subunit
METLDISKFCKTKTQATDFSTQVTTITEKLFETNFNLENVAMQVFGLQKKDVFLKLLHEQNINTQSQNDLKAFLTRLAEQANTLPVIALTIAFEPTEETMQAFAQWFMMQKGIQVLFDITVDKTLIAGVVVNFKGKHANYSIKSQFEQLTKTVLTTPVHSPSPQAAPQHTSETMHLGR